MANTYTQIHIHVVFAVQNRLSLIHKQWRKPLYLYIISIIQDRGHKVVSIGGTGDHIHILIGFRLNESLAQLIQCVKRSSSLWINNNKLVRGRFSWQEGYGAFSYSKNQVPTICNYIKNQEEHHKVKTFREEYEEWLKSEGVEYDQRFIFHDVYRD